jgi:hypothetical protein
MKPLTPLYPAAAFAALALAACGGQSAPESPAPGATSATAGSTPVIAPPPASGTSAPLPGDHARSRHYQIAITLPTLPANERPLAEALRATADNAKRGFLTALPDPGQFPEFADRRFQLQLNFAVASRTPAFTSVRESGMQDTGGAHPIPVQAAFVYDHKAGKLVTLDDLFVDADAARKALANFAHDTLLKKFMAKAPGAGEGSPEAIREWKANMVQMLNDGTQPTTVNYAMFVVRANSAGDGPSPGLTLIFPPYQVAPYVYGTQTVEVPASIFARFLKPGYRGDFANS